jgi:hypothetical protein
MRPPSKEPTLSSLIAEDKGLRIDCECNGVLRILSPLEAVASYGGKAGFSQVRRLSSGAADRRTAARTSGRRWRLTGSPKREGGPSAGSTPYAFILQLPLSPSS